MTGFPDDADLDGLDAAYRAALAAGDPELLPVVGYGEISVAFAWPPGAPRIVAKSLPPFDSPERLAAYAGLLAEYTGLLGGRGVDVVPSAVRSVGARAYVLQPLVRPVVSEVLRDGTPEQAEEIFSAIVDAVHRAVDDQVGLDCQVSNWGWRSGRLQFLDVTTPMLRDGRGRDLLDVRLFTDVLPWVARAPVRRILAPRLLDPYHDPRATLLDLAGNLIRERITRLLPVFLDVVNPTLERPLSEAEVRRSYKGMAATWAAIQAVRRWDRAWQQRVRRRPYPFLMPRHFQR